MSKESLHNEPGLARLEGERAAPRTSSSRRALLIGAGVLTALALALGLGLGLGLKHHHHNDGGAPAASATPTLVQLVPLNELVNASQVYLDPSFTITSTPTTRTYDWHISEISGAPLGVGKAMLAVNGISPGPIIRANTGDTILVNVTNGLNGTATALHWHGIYQIGSPWMDGTTGITQCGIPPGESMLYNFTLDGNWTGTTWWHAHFATQYTDGLYGALVVHAPQENVPKYDRDVVVLMNDHYNTPSADLLSAYLADTDIEPANEPVPDGGLVNGVGQFSLCSQYPDQPCVAPGGSMFNFTFEPNMTYRLRLINSGSFAGITFSVDNHTLELVEVDGTTLAPQNVSVVQLQVAQRASVLLRTAQQPGAYWVRAAIDDAMFTAHNDGLVKDQRAVLRYGVSNTTMPAPLAAAPSLAAPAADETKFVPADVQAAPDASATVVYTFSIQKTAAGVWRTFFNDTAWVPPAAGASALFSGTARGVAQSGAFAAPDGTQMSVFDSAAVVDVVLENLDDGDHPFHLHGHKFWIMARGKGRLPWAAAAAAGWNATNPLRRDTLLVPAYTYAVLRVQLDHAGYWALHCHIAWHMAAGGLTQLVTMPGADLLAPESLPPRMVQICKDRGSGDGEESA